MTSKERETLERAFQKKHVKKIVLPAAPLVLMASTIDPLVAPPLTLVDAPIASAPTLVSKGGEVAPPVAQALSSLSGDVGLPEEVSMEVENITTLSNETFVVEAVILVERIPEESIEATSSLVGMIGTTSPIKKRRVKVIDSICAPKESIMEAIFNSPVIPFSSNLPQLSADIMLENSDMGAAM